jgi:signal transduction histidine kinase
MATALFQSVSNIFTFIANFPSIGLIVFLIAIFAEVVLAIAVLRSDMRNATNIIFFLLSIATVCWLAIFYLGYLQQFYAYALLFSKLGVFFAAPMSSLFFLLADTFPSPRITLRPVLFWLTLAGTALMMGLNISPFAFSTSTSVVNGALHPVPSFGFIPFAILSTLFSVLAVYILIRKFIRASGTLRAQVRFVLTGTVIMLVLIILTVLIPILVFSSAAFLPLTPIYTLIFLAMTAYAIVKYGLFNVKIIATEALTITIWITLFSNIFVANSTAAVPIDIFVFVATVVLGIILIKSVRAEVQQREELARLNAQIQKNNEQLEDLSRFKSQLLSLASHQIKSPLAAIKGFVSLIVDGSYGEVGDKVKETLGKVQRSADDLIGLINTLLDVRKVEEGKMEYKFEQTDLNKLMGGTFELIKPLADVKKIEFSFTSPQKEIWINADPEKLKQVLQNLLDNAIKYTPSGFIRAMITEDALTVPGQTLAKVSVSDSGLGIASELIPHLFEEFVRDERVKKEIRGTGLGLYIARKITEAHGGKLWAESQGEGKGSTFYLTIPEVK